MSKKLSRTNGWLAGGEYQRLKQSGNIARCGRKRGMNLKSYFLRLVSALLSIIAFVAIAIILESQAGIPFKITYRIACAAVCLAFIAKIGLDYRGQRWPHTALLVALLFNIGLFFSPLAHLPASKGDLLFFGAPDAAILLGARIISYPVSDDHQRAVRQQMIMGFILASAFCAIILAIMFIPPSAAR